VALLLLLAFGCREPRPVADPQTLRTLDGGEIVGTTLEDGAVHAWRGLPYARPPIGDRRWRAPQPPEPWEGRREALESGSHCAQLGGDPVLGSEDCLTLDVYAPAFARDEVPTGSDRRPVMYWIHGGGNSMGWGDQLPPARLVAEGDVILVTINYRLGVFGWLSHPALRASAAGPDDASGNFGTLDMIRGLEWVRENIAHFGGDPERVTIFGESAGAIDVFSLLLSPRAEGLFHAAIAQSGVPTTMTRVQAEAWTDAEDPGLPGSSGELLVALLQQSGRAADRASAKEVVASLEAAEIESFLRGLSTEEILQPFVEVVDDGPMPIYIVPTVFRDGYVIPDVEPLEAFATPGAYNAVPFIAGANREESKLFLAFSSPHVSRVFGVPTGLENERLYDVEGEYGGLVWRAQGVDEPISAMQGAQGPSVWAYRFDWDEEGRMLGVDLSEIFGAAHAVEMLFVFGLTDLGFANRFVFEDRESAETLSRAMQSYWSEFAHTHRPGRGRAGELPEWPAWSPERGEPKYLVFDSTRDGGIHVGTDRVDQAFVLERALRDPRLLDDAERCGVFRNMVQWSSVLTVEEYGQLQDGACREFPLESRLPFGSLSVDKVAN
jgi:para-nitrobenzyl esterase